MFQISLKIKGRRWDDHSVYLPDASHDGNIKQWSLVGFKALGVGRDSFAQAYGLEPFKRMLSLSTLSLNRFYWKWL